MTTCSKLTGSNCTFPFILMMECTKYGVKWAPLFFVLFFHLFILLDLCFYSLCFGEIGGLKRRCKHNKHAILFQKAMFS